MSEKGASLKSPELCLLCLPKAILFKVLIFGRLVGYFLKRAATCFSTSRLSFLFPILCLLVATAFMFLDIPILQAVHRNTNTEIHSFFKFFSQFGMAGDWIYLSVLLYLVPLTSSWFQQRVLKKHIASFHHEKYAARTLFLLVVLASVGILVHLAKFIVGRSRPEMFLEDGVYSFTPLMFGGRTDSFPSGHSTIAWGGVGALIVLFPKFRIPLFLFGVLVSASRIMLERHYLSDILAGATLSLVVVIVVARIFEYLD